MMSSAQSDNYTNLFSTLSPGYLTMDNLNGYLDSFIASDFLISRKALFDNERFHTEIFHNVDAILAYYEANMTQASVGTYLAAKAEKDLIWVALQLYARLQTIDADVGVILQSKTEFKKCRTQWKQCFDLLERSGINHNKIKSLRSLGPQQSEDELNELNIQASGEERFQAFLDEIDKRNDLRLFWVWGRSSLDLGLQALGQTEAHHRLDDTSYLPGQISWSLYLFRGSLYLYHYLQKRRPPAWISDLPTDEQEQCIADYQKMYWDVYKYRILNDLVFWGPINLACFGWWFGEDFYGWLGDFATIILLCVDVYLAELKQFETQAQATRIEESYNKQLGTMSEDIFNQLASTSLFEDAGIDRTSASENQLLALDQYLVDQRLNNAAGCGDSSDLLDKLAAWKDVYRHQRDFQRRTEQTWCSLNYDRIYSWTLLFAFTMSASLLLPGGVPMLQIMGTVLCTVLTIVHRIVKAQLDISNHQVACCQLKQEIDLYNPEFEKLKAGSASDITIEARKQTIYQSRENARAKMNYEQGMISYEYLELMRTTFLRFSVPIVIGVAMIYAPAMVMMVPTYVFVLAASALLSYALACYTKSQKPDDVMIKAFDSTL